MTILAIRDKTLNKHYKGDYGTCWEDVRNALIIQSATLGEASAKWFVERTFDQIRHRVYYGNIEALKGRYRAKLAGDWAYINRKEELYKRMFKKLELDQSKIKPITLKATEEYDHGTTRDSNISKSNQRKISNRNETAGETNIIAQEIPTSPIDMLAGQFGDIPTSDQFQVKHKESQGRREKIEGEFEKDAHGNFYPKYKTLPNVVNTTGSIVDKGFEKSKDVEKGKTFRTDKREEMPSIAAQLAKIVQSFPMVESEFESIIKSYDNLGFYSTFMPLGEIGIDPDLGDMGYVPPEKTKRGQAEAKKEEMKKTIGASKEDLEPLGKEVYEQMKKAGKPVEKSWVLENLARRKEKVKNVSEKQNQNIATLRKALNSLIEAYWEPVQWTTLAKFDKVMNSITGFKEFKRELRNRTELIERYRRRGKKMKQVFYCLNGKAGVGKTEISTRLAKAYMRPIQTLGMAGVNHPKILKGMRPTLNNAKYGGVAGAFIDEKYAVFKKLEDLIAEYKLLATKKAKKPKSLTRLEGERIDFLKKEIEEVKKHASNKGKLETQIKELKEKLQGKGDNDMIDERIRLWELEKELEEIGGRYYDLSSQAPIILLDEFEKAKDETVLFIVGQMTDKGINWNYYDEFLECNIDLSQAIILLTSNYWWKVPDFVRSRCKRVNINLLSYKDRMEILHTILSIQIRDRFYSDNPKEDTWRQAKGTYTEKQIEVLRKIGVSNIDNKGVLSGADKFLRLCMTEEFGVRGSIQNLEYLLDYLELMDERGWLDQIKSMYDDIKGGIDNIEEITNPDGSGVLNITYNFKNVEYMEEKHASFDEVLTFDKKRDIEVVEEAKTKKGVAECVLNMVEDWSDWKGKKIYDKKWKPPKQSKLSDDTENLDNTQAGFNYELLAQQLENEVNNTTII